MKCGVEGRRSGDNVSVALEHAGHDTVPPDPMAKVIRAPLARTKHHGSRVVHVSGMISVSRMQIYRPPTAASKSPQSTGGIPIGCSRLRRAAAASIRGHTYLPSCTGLVGG